MCRLFRRKHAPQPSSEAIEMREQIEAIRPRVESVVRERERLLRENNYAARIRAIYEGGRS